MKLNQDTIAFIRAHEGEDICSLRLRFSGKRSGDVDIPLALTQIEARKKASSKLPWLSRCPDFVFPDTLSAEQCTAQPVADYHADVARHPDSVLDLTCGLGVDVMTIASGAGRSLACDISPAHVSCVRHNAVVRGVKGFRAECTDARSLLEGLDSGERFDLVFADPARRDGAGARTYALADCSPDIVSLLPLIRRHTGRLLVKVSPMLDVKMLLGQLPDISHIHAVSLRGECKELLLDCDFMSGGQGVSCSAVSIAADGDVSVFTFEGLSSGEEMPVAGEDDVSVGAWIFEPDASLMKFINYAPLAARWPMLRKLGPNTHLYVGVGAIPSDLPGRVSRIEGSWSSYRHCAGCLPAQVNVVTRNFPDTPAQVKKRLKIRDGGHGFLYCCRVGDRRTRLLLCSPCD